MQASKLQVSREIAQGDCLTLADVAAAQGVARTTVFQWLRSGLPDAHGGRVRLTAIMRGAKWVTSRAALARFFGALPQSVGGAA